MWTKIGCGLMAVVAGGLLLRPAKANRNFVPDWTFKDSSIAKLRTLGEAERFTARIPRMALRFQRANERGRRTSTR